MKSALYVHIPFCAKKCPYCAFYKTLWDQDLETRFLSALESEITYYKDESVQLTALFIGGGTPNSLSNTGLKTLFNLIQTNFNYPKSIEKTAEINPEQLTKSNLEILKSAHINRISMGVQSFNQKELTFLGRQHSNQTVLNAYSMLREHGFQNINIDLIFGLPGSTIATLENSLIQALALNPEHMSTYSLTIEKGTEFEKNKIQPVHNDQELAQYKHIQTRLKQAGYIHYEVSAFAKPGYQSDHNKTYWQLDPFIGLGPSASSYFKGTLYKNVSSLDDYCRAPKPAIYQKTPPSYPKDQELSDYLMTNLRLLIGVSIPKTNARFKTNIEEKYHQTFTKLQSEGLLKKTKTRLKLTQKGVNLLDDILLEFV